MNSLFDPYRRRVAASTSRLFDSAPYPLANTLGFSGDPGLFGPDSVTWPVIGDTAAFIGGIRALLIQAAHPEVMAGVAEHSRYREDPLGRLSRTAAYVTATAFGARPEVEHAVASVRGAHRPVHGQSHRFRQYSAGKPDLAAWVHNALTDSFLTAYRVFGLDHIPHEQADRFVQEQTTVGSMLGAEPLPTQASDLTKWLEEHPDVDRSPGLVEATAFLRSPPLPWHIQAAYRGLFEAALATVGPRLRDVLGLRARPGAIVLGRAAVASLRWSLGASPSWHLALVRVGAPVPPGRFSQPLRQSAVVSTGR